MLTRPRPTMPEKRRGFPHRVAYQNKGNNAKAAEWLRKVTAGSNVAAAKELLTSVTAA
ncbi:Uncharacterised protein [Rikenella microfusus]|uniref:Uncharacterized protein n=1 Tax=Rikenella microfusus TaxID=28139 RepID=A0A379NCQ3_9BACT|nr:Uncharacterised protein [Rikenella microfusus]